MESTEIRQTTSRRAHVLRTREDVALEQLTDERARALFRGQSEVGRSAHVIVYSDGTTAGDATAQAILQSAEADYQATQAWFGGIDLPPGQDGDDQSVPRTAPPVQVLIDPQAGGAYHFGCDATDVYVEPDPQLASGLFVAELVEIFEAALNTGWSCGQTNGEGLSRVLAGERNPNLGSLLVQTEQAWWADGHADFVTDNSADDTNQDANGCATLFLYYLHSQLGYEWGRIVAAGGSSLGETYQRLSGQDAAAGFAAFVAQLATLDVGGSLNIPASGNPYPLAAAPAQPEQPTQAGAAQPEPVPVGGAPDGSMADGSMADGSMVDAAGSMLVEREVDIVEIPVPAADGEAVAYAVAETVTVTPIESALDDGGSMAADAAGPTDMGVSAAPPMSAAPEPPTAAQSEMSTAALERTAPVTPRALDEAATAERRGGSGMPAILGVLVAILVVLVVLAALFATGVIQF